MIDDTKSHDRQGHESPSARIAARHEGLSLRHSRVGERAVSLSLLVALLVVWEAAVRVFAINPIVLPPPSEILAALWGGLWAPPLRRDSYVYHALYTGGEALIGFFVGSTLGIAVGLWTAQSRSVERLIMPYVKAIQAIPKVALAPLFVIWLGFGMASKIWVAILISFFPLVINSLVGLRSVDLDFLDVARLSNGSKWRTFKLVQLPFALPYIFAGLELAIIYSVVGAITAEFVGATRGLGLLIQQKTVQVDTRGVFSILLVMSAMGLSYSWVLRTIRERVLFWSPEIRGRSTGL